MLKASNITRNYNGLHVLKGVDIFVNKGEIVSIVGSSGAGKSTLLHILGSLDKANSGEIWINNERIDTLKEKELAKFRNQHIGFVYQFHHLLNEFSALENVSLPNLISGKTPAEAQQEAIQLLTKVGLSDRLHHRPAELSGGERQRVAIARALACKPSLVLMDEPTGNLDPKTAEAVLDLLIGLNKDLGISLVVVTHDPLIAQRMDRTVRLEEGVLESQLD